MEIHGGIDKDVIDFSISVNPYTPSWKGDLFRRCEKLSGKYTYVEWIEKKFREKFGEDTVVLAGATEALSIIGSNMIEGKVVIIPQPSYSEYERISSKAKKVIKIPSKSFKVDLENTFENALKQSKDNKVMVFVGNPNNPTGEYFQVKSELEFLANHGIFIVLDEAFIDFVDEEQRWSIEHPNILIIRTFTKSYGMPGIRVGYVKNKSLIGFFELHRSPWAIGSCGYAFIEYLLKDDGKFLKESIKLIKKEVKRFERIGMNTDANFGILNVGNAAKVQKMLDKIGVHVRNCESFDLPEWIRVSVRKKEENDIFFQAMKKVVKWYS